MRKVIAGFTSSIDGYFHGPYTEYDRILTDKEIDLEAQAQQFDTYFFGRNAYEAQLASGNQKRPELKNYVFSNTMTAVDEPYILITGNHIKDEVLALKAQEGKDIALYGGAFLLSSLLNLRLVDEIHISIITVLLGKGSLITDVLKEKHGFQLLESTCDAKGSLQVRFVVKNTRA